MKNPILTFQVLRSVKILLPVPNVGHWPLPPYFASVVKSSMHEFSDVQNLNSLEAKSSKSPQASYDEPARSQSHAFKQTNFRYSKQIILCW